MSVFQLLTPITYWLLIAMWAYILFFFMRRLRFRRAESSLIITLIIILAIDAFRTLFESIYFGAWYTSLSGFLPIGVHDFLVRAEMVIIPEFLNVIAAALIIGILLYRWFPAEKRDRELLEGTIKEHTIKLEKSNEQLRHEITERKQAVEETHLLLIATQAIGESQDFYDGLRFVLRNVCETTGWSFGEAWVPSSDGKILKCSPAWYGSTNSLRKFRKLSEEVTFPPNVGLPGRVWSSKQPEWIPDVSSESKAVFLRTQIMLESGLKAGYGVPIIANSQVLAVLVFFMFEPREEDNRLVELISVVATQLGSVILRKQAEEALKKQTYDIGERVKELRCLYAVSDLAKQDIPSEEIFQRIIDLVPPAWQYPEVTCARLTVNSQEFRTKNFRETAWKQTSDIVVRGNRIGNVEVCYLEEKPESDEGPFLKEERDLIIAITRHLGETIERKQAEREIKRAAEEWATTFDSITDLVSIHDKDFRLVRVNKAFADLFKMKPEELIGKYCYEVAHGANEPAPYCPHKQTLDDGKPHRLEYFETHLGIHLEMIVSPIFDEKGEVSGTVHITEDITERKKMEEQLIVTDRLASIGELSSGIAHELNNPLTSVIGFSELLLEKDVSDDVKEDLAVINREAKRTAVVVRNLLTFARKHHTEKKPVDIHDIIQKVLELRAYEQKVSNITVNTRSTPNLPEIIADGFQLQQVFLNIIINAEHFLKETHQGGTLTITTERVGNIVRVSFADDGPGIAEENLMHLFDPFFTTKEVGKGTGLGLSICHGIITEHGGRIYAESELGKGATFIVELPIPSRGGESNEKS